MQSSALDNKLNLDLKIFVPTFILAKYFNYSNIFLAKNVVKFQNK